MEWFKFYVRDLRDRLLMVTDDAAVGAWVRLLAKCYELENGGRFEGCREYSDRQWLVVAGVDREAVERAVAAGLATRQGDSLRVQGYDVDLEEKATNRSRQNRELALRRWGNAKGNAKGNAEGEGEREREGEREKEGDTESRPSRASRRAPKRVERPVTKAFEDFWAAFPADRRNCSKAKAGKLWPGDDLAEKLAEHVRAMVASGFTFGLHKYLSERLWEVKAYPQLTAPRQASGRDARHGHAAPADFSTQPLGEVTV
jgi:hypothetical protein